MQQIVRCSGLARPVNCPGFLKFQNLPEFEGGQPAMDGTAVGEYLAKMLTTRNLDVEMIAASNGVVIDNDMRFYVKPIAEEILKKGVPIRCETKHFFDTSKGIRVQGSSDIAYEIGDTLYIEDLKYGWRIVEVEKNWQLIGYALCEIARLQKHFKFVEFAIHQPRPFHEEGSTRRWRITTDELFNVYYKQIDEQLGRSELKVGSHCRYCPAAAGQCPAFNKEFFESVYYVTQDFSQNDLTDAQISLQLDIINRIKDVLEIKQDSINQLATLKIKEGRIIPGYDLEHRYGDRKWKSSISSDFLATVTGKNVMTEELLSPAKLEKLGVPKEIIGSLTERRFVGSKMVKKDTTKQADKIFGKGV